jgi:hypothetical protein
LLQLGFTNKSETYRGTTNENKDPPPDFDVETVALHEANRSTGSWRAAINTRSVSAAERRRSLAIRFQRIAGENPVQLAVLGNITKGSQKLIIKP